MCDPRDVDGALQYGNGAKEAVRPAARSVSVCIVNFNSGTFLAECVDAVLRSTVLVEVLVSDNGSSDNSIRLLRERIGDDTRVRIMENHRNLGFAKAANIALRSSTGDFCLLLNPDCLVLADALERAAKHFSEDPEVGLVGCLIRNPDGSEQAGARRSVPTPWRSLVRVLHLDKWLPPHPRLRTFLHVFDPIPDRPITVEAISGAFMLVSRRALMQVGLLDEGYFLHCEDLDWCMRFRRAGWKIAFVPDAEVIHYKGTCSRSRPIFVEWHKHRGMVRFYGAHFRHQYPFFLRPFVVSAVWARFVLLVCRILVSRVTGQYVTEYPPVVHLTRVVPGLQTIGKDALRTSAGTGTALADWHGRQVLVTGGTGFIGRTLVKKLIAAGAQVKVLKRSRARSTGAKAPDVGQLEVRIGDLSERGSLRGVCKGVDTVFHLAGYAHAEDTAASLDESPHWSTTVEGTRELLDEACAAGVKRMIFVSSVKAMGAGGNDCLDESSLTVPEDYYGIAKLRAERLILAKGECSGMHAAVLRLPMVYGRHNEGNLPRMIRVIDQGRFPPLPETDNRRSMVHVDDVVQGLFLAAERPIANGQIYIVTDNVAYSASRLYESISAALGKKPAIWRMPVWLLWGAGRLGDAMRALRLPAPVTSGELHKLFGSAWYSDAKIRRELGYFSRHTLFDALPDMVEAYRHRSRFSLEYQKLS